jgi:hypothetical protein
VRNYTQICFITANLESLATLSQMLYLYFLILGVWITLIFFYGIASVGSVYGNGLVLWIVRTTKSLQNVNNLLVANLAITDIVLAALVTPFQAYAAMEQRWDMPEFMCKLCPFVQNTCVNVNVFNLILIARDR